jgi:hypothetical protein
MYKAFANIEGVYRKKSTKVISYPFRNTIMKEAIIINIIQTFVHRIISSSHWHDSHRVVANCSLFTEARLSNSILVFEIRDNVLETVDFDLVLAEYSLSLGIHGRLEDAGSMSIDAYFSLACTFRTI